jgi:nephrocystin-4
MAHRPPSKSTNDSNVAKIVSNTTLTTTSTQSSGSAINVSRPTNRNKQQSTCSWRDIFALHRDVLPFAGERTDEVATNLSTSYNIHIQQLDGLQLKGEELKVEYEVRLHLYDVTYKVFFGKSWIGPRRMIKKDTSQGSRLHYNVPIYFHTSLADPNIILVIEIVQVSVSKNGHVQLLSNGWGILRLFQQGDYTDTSQSTPSVIRRQELFHGSPRALFFLGDDISGKSVCKTVILP